jgi:hypothetical protein
MTALFWLADRLIRGWRWAALVAVPVALAVIRAALIRQGRREAEAEAVKDAAERVDKGRAAVADGRERGSPDERLRRNDGRWR